jgi:hypothetical protein
MNQALNSASFANALIDELGGTSEVASLFNIKPPSVSEWRVSGIPEARLMYLCAVYPDKVAVAHRARKNNRKTAA